MTNKYASHKVYLFMLKLCNPNGLNFYMKLNYINITFSSKYIQYIYLNIWFHIFCCSFSFMPFFPCPSPFNMLNQHGYIISNPTSL